MPSQTISTQSGQFEQQAPDASGFLHVTPEASNLADWQAKELALAGALRESLVAVTSSPSVEIALNQILDSVASVIAYEGATILLFEGEHVRVAHARGFSAETQAIIQQAFLPTSKSHFQQLLATQQPYLIDDTRLDPGWLFIPGTDWIRASVGVPIVIQDRVIGLIAIDSSQPGAFDASDVARVQLFARYAALAVNQAYQNDFLAGLVEARTAQLQQATTTLEMKEALLRSAQRIAHLGSWTYDPATQRVEWSEELYKIAGRDPAQGIPSIEEIAMMLTPTEAARFITTVHQIQDLQAPIEAEFSFVRSGETGLRHAYVRAEMVEQPGAMPQMQGIVLDITARKQAEEALRQALAHEKELNELKSRFVAMASHEFRNPLSLILANVELLRTGWRQQAAEVTERQLDMIQNQATALNDIIRRLLELLRIQAGAVEFQPTRIELTGLCRNVLHQLQRPASSHPPIQIQAPAEPIWVWGDVLYLHRIVDNLVGNAQKYTLNGAPVQLTVTAAETDAVLRIEDCGIGIAPADLERLYEPFHRGGNVQAIPGTGLGMALVKQLVELHRARIHVESEVGRGTAVTLYLPLALDMSAT